MKGWKKKEHFRRKWLLISVYSCLWFYLSHFLNSRPSGAWMSIFFSPTSFQFVDNTVPPDSLFKTIQNKNKKVNKINLRKLDFERHLRMTCSLHVESRRFRWRRFAETTCSKPHRLRASRPSPRWPHRRRSCPSFSASYSNSDKWLK